jgi:hypothetical protein
LHNIEYIVGDGDLQVLAGQPDWSYSAML